MASVPFNSSTAIMWINKDAFEKAGLDPSKPPATYDEVQAAGEAMKSKNAVEIPISHRLVLVDPARGNTPPSTTWRSPARMTGSTG